MTYAEYTAAREALETRRDDCGRAMAALSYGVPRGAMGMTADSVKRLPAWQEAYRGYHAAHNAVGRLMRENAAHHKTDLAASRARIEAKRAAVQA